MPNWRGNLASLAVVAALSLGGSAMLYGQHATNDSMSTRSDTGMTKHASGRHHKSSKAKNGTTGASRADSCTNRVGMRSGQNGQPGSVGTQSGAAADTTCRNSQSGPTGHANPQSGTYNNNPSSPSSSSGATDTTNRSSPSSSAGADTMSGGSKPPTGASWYYTPEPAWSDEVRETH